MKVDNRNVILTNDSISDIIIEAANEKPETVNAISIIEKKANECLISVNQVYNMQPCVLSMQGIECFEIGDIQSIKAKQKNGKTSSIAVLCGAALSGRSIFGMQSLIPNARICVFHTEENPLDSQNFNKRILKMAGLPMEDIYDHLRIYNIREKDVNEKVDYISSVVKAYKPQLVFIDGIVDLIKNFNDVEESKEIVTSLQVLASENNAAIVVVLHTNKGENDDNMRGHLGTILSQKSTLVLQTKNKNGVFTVTCSESRHEKPEPWSFTFDTQGNIIDAKELAVKEAEEKIAQKNAEAEKRLAERKGEIKKIILEAPNALERKYLVELAMQKLALGKSMLFGIIADMIEKGELIEKDKKMVLPETSDAASAD